MREEYVKFPELKKAAEISAYLFSDQTAWSGAFPSRGFKEFSRDVYLTRGIKYEFIFMY